MQFGNGVLTLDESWCVNVRFLVFFFQLLE